MNSNNSKKNEHIRTVFKVILIVSVTALLLVVCIGANEVWVRYFAQEHGNVKKPGKQPGIQALYITHLSGAEGARFEEGRVNWWRDKDTGIYYVFLPSTADTDKLRLGLEGVGQIYMDGNRINNLDLFSVQLGEHTITTGEGGKEYKVNFLQSSNTAAVFINTESGSMHHIDSIKGNKEGGKTLILAPDGKVQYAGVLDNIKGRGNVTWDEDKKGYSIKLSRKTDLFGMGAANKWVLLANYYDSTMLRNYVTQDFAGKSGTAFTKESVFVDFYTNGDYMGTYQLCEKVEIGPERVEIPDLEKQTENVNPGMALDEFPVFGSTKGTRDTVPDTSKGYRIEHNPEDITGGYLIELDTGGRYIEEESGFVTARNQAVVIESPAYASEKQVAYIRDKYQEFEDALYDWDGINQNTGKNYYEYIDLDSFARKYLVEEITKNLDASISSLYLYKYPDEISDKLFAGPIWDYDRAIGNFGIGYNDEDLSNPEGMYASQDVTSCTIWYAVFFRPEFHEAVLNHYYGAFRENVLLQAKENIDVQAELLEDTVIMNAIRWDQYLTTDRQEILDCYQEDVNYMKDFLIKRIAFLDEEWKDGKRQE